MPPVTPSSKSLHPCPGSLHLDFFVFFHSYHNKYKFECRAEAGRAEAGTQSDAAIGEQAQ